MVIGDLVEIPQTRYYFTVKVYDNELMALPSATSCPIELYLRDRSWKNLNRHIRRQHGDLVSWSFKIISTYRERGSSPRFFTIYKCCITAGPMGPED